MAVKVCYVESKGKDGRIFCNKIGIAFVNPDGTLKVKLEALPVSGWMVIGDHIPKSGQQSLPVGTAPASALDDDGDIPF